jgi:hypothetical protein
LTSSFMNRRIWLFLSVLLLLLILTACSSAAPEPETAVETVIVEGETVVETVIVEEPMEEEPAAEESVEDQPPAPSPTAVPSATQAPQPTQAPPPTLVPTPTILVEPRLVEVEWPESMYLGDSDVVRMALIPSEEGYKLTTEFPDHTTTTQDVPVVRPEGYDLSAIGRLDGVGFRISPAKDQASSLPLDQPVTWHWSLTPEHPGQQRLIVSLLLRWEPLPGTAGDTREAVAYSKGLEMQVKSFFGLSRGQTLNTALVGLALGGSMIVLAAFYGFPLGRGKNSKQRGLQGLSKPAQIRKVNRELEIEQPAGLQLNPEEDDLLRGLFQRYQRLLIQQEFLSGYSGARTFLLIPVRVDGRSDAPTIAKLGRREDIEQEYANYEAFVKRTLPPVTARIQAPPVMLKSGDCAALQYTFIGEPGSRPISLRQALLDEPNPELLTRLFETFGPNWWMQRVPWTFRMAQEYDRLLPPHWILEPDTGKGLPLDGGTSPGAAKLAHGDLVAPRNFTIKDRGGLRDYLTLKGDATNGQPALRLRWLSKELPRSAVGRVAASRMDLLRSYVTGFDLMGLPDPLEKLPDLLNETVRGTRSIIHGDLNLENVLIGPGGMVWLIDFATTREGHPLMDFAHLEAEIIAHVTAPQVADAKAFVAILEMLFAKKPLPASRSPLHELLSTVHEIAAKFIANPSQPREYWLALYMSCLGALKYRNLDEHQKYLLYLTAGFIAGLL